MKIIIAGGRDFDNYPLLCNVCDYLLKDQTDVTIISGMAVGADMLGYDYAKERGYKLIKKPAKWNDILGKPKSEIKVNKGGNKYWVLAGHHRNIEMANEGDALIAFWDGKSTGTRHMIHEATKRGLTVKVIKY